MLRRVLLCSICVSFSANTGAAQTLAERDPSKVEHRRVQKTIRVFADRVASAPGANSVVSAKTIETIAADHPAEILNTLPGVNIHTNSGQEHLIAIRSPVLTGGAGQGSFLVLENGVPTRSPAFGNVNLLLEPHHETAEAIEVVRGPGSAKYGSNAVHGLINVILTDPSGKALKEVHGSYGSLGRYKTDLIYDQGYLGRASLSIQSDTGWRDETGGLQIKGSGVAEYVLAGWNLTAWGSAAYLEQETADFIEGVDAYEDRDLARTNDDPLAYRDAWSARGAFRLDKAVGDNGEFSITPFARIQQMDFRQHFLPYRGFEENGHTAIGAMVRYENDAGDGIVWRLGTDVDLARGYLEETQPEPFGFFPSDERFPVGTHYDYSVDTAVLALWGEVDWDITDNLKLLAGLRGEAHAYDYTTDAAVGVNGRFFVPEDRSDTFEFAAPKLGLVYAASETVDMYANLARGARAPQTSDLYRLQSLQGVAEADIETLDSFEIGVRGIAFDGKLGFDLAAYHAQKDNFFFRDANGLNVSDGSTEHKGIEAAFDAALGERFSFSGNVNWADQIYTFSRDVNNGSEVITSGDRIDTAPEWLGDLSLAYAATDKLNLAVSLDHVGEYFLNPANTETYPGHTVFALRGSYEVSETLKVYGIARNLFDEAYADRADFAFGNERYFPGEPLNLTIGVRKRL